ncbi:MAG: S1C family serine protease [Candidatus Dormibacteraeota bacterium]|nr:S1C family serine protease [Candidatus Dormibacteraeota bacterium]
MSRGGNSAGTLTVVVWVAVVAVAGCGGDTGAFDPASSSAAANGVAAAVVNIDGHVSGGSIAGTGMIIRSDGLVLTNNHVVAGTTDLVAQVDGQGKVYQATVLGVDPTHDVAVIRLEGAKGLPTVSIDTSGVVATGDSVIGLGNAEGHNGAPVSASGSVTTLDETLMVAGDNGLLLETLNGLIQFDAAIQPGDSGGPLLNASGQVIGMDTVGSNPNQPAADVGRFGGAIPINTAMSIVDQIVNHVSSPYIQSGHSGTLGADLADSAAGATVKSVVSGGGAATAGMVKGDVITTVAGAQVHSATDVERIMLDRRPGDAVPVAWSDPAGNAHQGTVTLSPGPPA